MKRVDWFDEKTHVPVIDEQVQKLSAFVDAMADGVIDHAELEKQQSSVIEAMKAVEAGPERRAAREDHAAAGGVERV